MFEFQNLSTGRGSLEQIPLKATVRLHPGSGEELNS